MGKTRTAFIGDEQAEKRLEEERKRKKEAKIAAKKEAAKVRVPGLKGGERVVAIEPELPAESAPSEALVKEGLTTTPTAISRQRGQRYLTKRALVDPKKLYSPSEAVKLAQETSISRFDGKVELHMSLAKKGRFEVTLPHPFESSKKRIEVANDDTVEKLKKGVVDFEILLTTPEFLPKLVPFARLLGPRGLMPNPKTGTIVQNPETAMEKFSGGTLLLQTEKDAPIIHTVVGKISNSTDELVKNLTTVIKSIGKQNIKKASVSASMGPGIKMSI